MAITIWDRNKDDESLLNTIQLEAGTYIASFASNVMTRNTILLVADKQKEPFSFLDRTITVLSTNDDGSAIKIKFSVKRGGDSGSSEAGFGKALTIMGVLGALGIIAVVFLNKVEKTAGALAGGLPEFLLKNGVVLLGVLGIGVAFYVIAKTR